MANVYDIDTIQDILASLDNMEMEKWIELVQDNDPDGICEGIEEVRPESIDWDTFNVIVTVDCGKREFTMEIDLNEIM